MLAKYNGSPSLLLASVYSDYNWLPWKFTTLPRNYWNDIKNQRKFMNWVSNELNIKENSDWYNIKLKVTLLHSIFQVENG
jgi:hypothetical protein